MKDFKKIAREKQGMADCVYDLVKTFLSAPERKVIRSGKEDEKEGGKEGGKEDEKGGGKENGKDRMELINKGFMTRVLTTLPEEDIEDLLEEIKEFFPAEMQLRNLELDIQALEGKGLIKAVEAVRDFINQLPREMLNLLIWEIIQRESFDIDNETLGLAVKEVSYRLIKKE